MITTIDIKDEFWEKAKVIAVKKRVSLKEIINRALEEYLKKVETKESPKGGKGK